MRVDRNDLMIVIGVVAMIVAAVMIMDVAFYVFGVGVILFCLGLFRSTMMP